MSLTVYIFSCSIVGGSWMVVKENPDRKKEIFVPFKWCRKIKTVFTSLRDFLYAWCIGRMYMSFIWSCTAKRRTQVIKLHFEENTKPNCIERTLGNIKSVEPTTFPRCTSVSTQHIKQAWYIAKLYKSVSETYPMTYEWINTYWLWLETFRRFQPPYCHVVWGPTGFESHKK